MRVVTLIFTDRHTEQHTAEEARRLCSTPETAGRIIDALTEDKELQNLMRRLMDEY